MSTADATTKHSTRVRSVTTFLTYPNVTVTNNNVQCNKLQEIGVTEVVLMKLS
jgi:hypothetical protein